MAIANFPVPSGPEKSCAWLIRSSRTDRINRLFKASCPITSLKNMVSKIVLSAKKLRLPEH